MTIISKKKTFEEHINEMIDNCDDITFLSHCNYELNQLSDEDIVRLFSMFKYKLRLRDVDRDDLENIQKFANIYSHLPNIYTRIHKILNS